MRKQTPLLSLIFALLLVLGAFATLLMAALGLIGAGGLMLFRRR